MTDHKAVYGSQPAWDLQQRKQEEFARVRDERLAKKDKNQKYKKRMNERQTDED